MNNLFNLKTHIVANSGNKKAVVKGSVPIYLKTLVQNILKNLDATKDRPRVFFRSLSTIVLVI